MRGHFEEFGGFCFLRAAVFLVVARPPEKPLAEERKVTPNIMSQPESSIGTPAPAAPPPSAPSPAAAPPAAPSAPTAAPVASTATSAVVAPGVPAVNDAVATAITPGAQPSEPAPPKSLGEVKERYHQQKAEIAARESTQPEATPGEAQISETPEPVPLETQPEAVEPEPVVEPVEAAPVEEATAPAETEDADYKEHFLTAEEIETRFNRKLSKKEREFIGQIETHRAALAKDRDAIGGDVGVRIASTINNVLLNVDDPTDDDVDAVFDQMVLPENAGAEKFFDKMGKRLVNMQLQESTCDSCHSDGNKPNPSCGEHVAMGKAFADNMISEEWGTNPDGTPFDFGGMRPTELVGLLLRALQIKDGDGDAVLDLNLEFLKAEVEGRGKPKPSARELELQRENEELRKNTQSTTAAKEAELERQRESDKATYNTQAKGVVTRAIMAEVTPLAIKAGWAPSEGEEGPQVESKKTLGRMVAADVNTHVMATAEYAAVQKMIDEKTAFDPVTGRMTPRFELKLKPVQTMAKAQFNKTLRDLASQIKFAASTSRNAQLVKNNGSKVATQPAAEAPSLAAAPKPQAERPLTAVEQLAQVKKKYREDVQRSQAQVGVR